MNQPIDRPPPFPIQSPENTGRLSNVGLGSALLGISRGLYKHKSMGNPVSSPVLLRRVEEEEGDEEDADPRCLPGAAPSFTTPPPLNTSASAPVLTRRGVKASASLDGDETLSIASGETLEKNPTLLWLLSLISSSRGMLDQLNSAVQMTRVQIDIAKGAERFILSKRPERLLIAKSETQPPSLASSTSTRQWPRMGTDPAPAATAAASHPTDPSFASCLHRKLDQLSTDLDYAMISAPAPMEKPPAASLEQREARVEERAGAVRSKLRPVPDSKVDHVVSFQLMQAPTVASASKAKQAKARLSAAAATTSSPQPNNPAMSKLLEMASNRWGPDSALTSVEEGDEEGRGSTTERKTGGRQDKPAPPQPTKRQFMRGGSLKKMMKNAREDAERG